MSAKVAVYVNGCFWHGCKEHGTWPKHNGEFWKAKIEQNITRDRIIDDLLAGHGWYVVRVWEHDDPNYVAREIEAIVRSRSSISAK